MKRLFYRCKYNPGIELNPITEVLHMLAGKIRKKEKRQHLKTLRYKYFVLPAQMGSNGRDAVLRISVQSRKIWAKLSSLFARISQYIPDRDPNCSAVGET